MAPVPDVLSGTWVRTRRGVALAVVVLIASGTVAHAQTPAAPTPPVLPVAPLPPGMVPDTPGGTTTNGVARPRGWVDPGMVKGAPSSQKFPMPVIPPPGGPGGNPAVKPK